MLDETNDDIFERIVSLTHKDAAVCKMLTMACVGMRDNESAESLLKRVREHLAITEDAESMYTAEYYLSYVKDLMELAAGFRSVPPVKILHESIRDSYEVLLYNKGGLGEVLRKIRKEERLEAMRENYWMN
jgi:hypothetical protein